MNMHIDDPKDMLRVLTELKNGRPVSIPNYWSYHTFPEETFPLLGFAYDIESPNCCDYHAGLLNMISEWYDKFPKCCAYHKKAEKQAWFKKELYENVPMMVFDKVNYTINVIEKCIEKEHWYTTITDYIEYTRFHFGHPKVGELPYTAMMIQYIKGIKPQKSKKKKFKITKDQRQRLITFLEGEDIDKGKKDLNLLIATSRKWASSIPDIHFFSEFKEMKKRGAPIFSSKHFNRFLGMYRFVVRTQDELISFLTDATKEVLKRVDTIKLIEDGIISDTTATELEIINGKHKLSQKIALDDYSKGELRYAKYLKRWLKNEEAYFRKIGTLVKDSSKPLKVKNRTLHFYNYSGIQKKILLNSLKF